MKKVLAIAVLGVFTLASCKKDYTCQCSLSGNASGSTLSVNSTTITGTKKDAKKDCEAKSSSGNGVTTTCKIK